MDIKSRPIMADMFVSCEPTTTQPAHAYIREDRVNQKRGDFPKPGCWLFVRPEEGREGGTGGEVSMQRMVMTNVTSFVSVISVRVSATVFKLVCVCAPRVCVCVCFYCVLEILTFF